MNKQMRLIDQKESKPRPKKKEEALTVQRFINEVLVGQLSIPLRQIVNDTTFSKYTFLKRPDLLVSEFVYDQGTKNETQFIDNLVHRFHNTLTISRHYSARHLIHFPLPRENNRFAVEFLDVFQHPVLQFIL